jgi:hypothetical protein
VFDPRVTEWVFRAKRMYDEPGGTVVGDGRRVRLAGGYEAVAEEDAIVLRRIGADGKAEEVCRVPARATHLAGEGEWLVAYEPSRKALVRYRVVLMLSEASEYGRIHDVRIKGANRENKIDHQKSCETGPRRTCDGHGGVCVGR